MRHGASIGALGALLASSAATAEPFSLNRPAEGEWGPLVLALVEHNRARSTGGSFCPQSDDAEEICLDASILQGSAESIHYLSPRPEGWRHPGRFPRVRFLGAHAARGAPSGSHLAILEQTDNGYLWRVWATSIEGDLACLPQDVIVRFQIRTSLRYRASGGQENCFRLSDLD